MPSRNQTVFRQPQGLEYHNQQLPLLSALSTQCHSHSWAASPACSMGATKRDSPGRAADTDGKSLRLFQSPVAPMVHLSDMPHAATPNCQLRKYYKVQSLQWRAECLQRQGLRESINKRANQIVGIIPRLHSQQLKWSHNNRVQLAPVQYSFRTRGEVVRHTVGSGSTS